VSEKHRECAVDVGVWLTQVPTFAEPSLRYVAGLLAERVPAAMWNEMTAIIARHFPDEEQARRVSPTGDGGGCSRSTFRHSAATSPAPGEHARRAEIEAMLDHFFEHGASAEDAATEVLRAIDAACAERDAEIERFRDEWCEMARGAEITRGQDDPAARAFRQCIGDLARALLGGENEKPKEKRQ